MDNLLIILVLFFIVFSWIFILLGIKKVNKKLPEEVGQVLEFETRCGGVINYIRYTSPFVRLAIYKDFVVISYLFGNYVIPRSDLKVSVADSLFLPGIHFVSGKYPKSKIRIFHLNKEKVLSVLEKKEA